MIRTISVLGTGTMGRGIAYVSAVAGFDTFMHDSDPAALEKAQEAIESLLQKGSLAARSRTTSRTKRWSGCSSRPRSSRRSARPT